MAVLVKHDNKTIPTLTRSKDPDETDVFYMVWDNVLASDETIASAVWDTGTLTEVSSSINNSMTFDDVAYSHVNAVYLSGGTAGTTVTVANKITTDSATPRIIERSFKLPIAEL